MQLFAEIVLPDFFDRLTGGPGVQPGRPHTLNARAARTHYRQEMNRWALIGRFARSRRALLCDGDLPQVTEALRAMLPQL